jgi:hypothetical protein
MSYDIALRPPAAGPALPKEQFLAFLKERPHYTVNEEERRAFYENEITGVYFTFEAASGKEVKKGGAPFAFSLNVFRAPFFVLEAEQELGAVVAALGLRIEDKNEDGMPGEAFDGEAFNRGWTLANGLAYHQVLHGDEPPILLTQPHATLLAAWRWNYAYPQTVAEHGDMFVPNVAFFQLDEEAETAALWPDAKPVLLPRVDRVILVRTVDGEEKHHPLPWFRIAPLLAKAERSVEVMQHFALPAPTAAEWEALLAHPPLPAGELVGADDLHSEEMVERFSE